MNHRMSRARISAAASLSLSLILVAGCDVPGASTGSTEGESGRSDGEPSHGLVFHSDRSFIFEHAGERAALDVMVYRHGERVRSADLRYTSSDPGVISVTPEGVLVAEADLGSAVITVEADGVSPVTANAVIADLAPRARRIDSDQIVEVDRDIARATIQIQGDAAPLAAGDVLIGSERDGLFVRVTDVWLQDDGTYVVVYDTDVALTDAFENLELRAYTDWASYDSEQHAEFFDDLGCAIDGDATLDFAGPEIDPRLDTRLVLDYELRSGFVVVVKLYAEAVVGAEASTGEARLEGRFGGEFRCSIPLADVVIPPVSVLGPALSLGGKLESRVGLKGAAHFDDVSVTYVGPSFASELTGHLGIEIHPRDGVSPIRDVELSRAEISHGELEGDLLQDGGLALEMAPFLEANLVLSPRFLGGLFGVDIDLLKATTAGGLDLEVNPPMDPYAAGYTGPGWELFVEGDVELGPLLANLPTLIDFLRKRLGMDVDADAFERLDPTLWNGRAVLMSSPAPAVVADRENVALGDEVELWAEELGRYSGSVEYLLHHCGEGDGESLADLPAGQSAHYTPTTASDRGAHGVAALLWDGLFGRVGLTYAAQTPASLRVGDDADAVCGR